MILFKTLAATMCSGDSLETQGQTTIYLDSWRMWACAHDAIGGASAMAPKEAE
jgi:hypothetical protein